MVEERFLRALAALDPAVVRSLECWLGGGIAVVLRCGDYRVSRDIDLLCSAADGYRELRGLVRSGGVGALLRHPLPLVREPRVDQYGVRFAVDVDGEAVKIEVINEGNVRFDPGITSKEAPVDRLTDGDLVATKLLANDDRFLDDATRSRDVLDLIMLEHVLGELPAASFVKAERAYGDTIRSSWDRARARLRDRPDHLERCLRELSVTDAARAVIGARLARP